MNISTPCGLSTRFFTIVFCLIGFGIAHAQDTDEEIIIYVNAAKERNNRFNNMHTYGTSWDTAFRYLHDALRFGDPNATQIWIAEGHYYVDNGIGIDYKYAGTYEPSDGEYMSPFLINSRDISIYGGFAGTESSLAERTDPHAHPTYLDGNVYYRETLPFPHPNNLYNTDNGVAKRILYVYNSRVTLDGLVFQYVRGSSLTATGVVWDYEGDAGHGAFIASSQSSLTINACTFQHGLGVGSGLVVYFHDNSLGEPLVITNSVIRNCGGLNAGSNLIRSSGDQKVVIKNTVFDNYEFQNSGNASVVEGVNAELHNIVFSNNNDLQLVDTGYFVSGVDKQLQISNLLAINNTLSSHLIDPWAFSSSTRNMTTQVTNSSFIGNTSSSPIIDGTKGSKSDGYEHVLRMHNNLFWGNRTTADGNTASTSLTLRDDITTLDISHNATDNSSDILLTDTTHNTGAVDLSGVTDAATLFASHEDADGTDDLWFTTDDGFVPIENSLLHNAGHNDAAATISSDLKGQLRTQQGTVDIGAYEFGEELTVGVEGLSVVEGLVLYPNPLRSRQGKSIVGYLTNPASNPKQLVLRDMNGRLVRSLPITDSKKAIDLGALSSGSYLAILSFPDGKQSHSFRVLVE